MGCCSKGYDENDKEKKMEFDPDFKGPIQNRGCTDIICCILFLAATLGFIAVGAWSYTKGDPILLLYPTDSEGNLCGHGDYEDKPYLFFFDLIDCAKTGAAVAVLGCPTPQVCVEECPTKYWEWYSQYAAEQADSGEVSDRDDMICKDGIDPLTDSRDVQELVSDEDCAAYYLESEPLAGRCIPAFIKKVIDKAEDAGELIVDKYNQTVSDDDVEKGSKYLALFLSVEDYGKNVIADVRATWHMIIVGLCAAMVWCFLWIVLMRWITGILVWLTIILLLVTLGIATAICFWKYDSVKKEPENNGAFTFTTNLNYYANLRETWLALGIIAGVLFLIVLLLVIALFNRIRIAIELIKEASRAISNMIFVLFWPIFPFFLQIGVIFYWAASAVFLASVGPAQNSAVNRTSYTNADGEVVTWVEDLNKRVPCDPDKNTTSGEICQFMRYGGKEYIPYLQAFQLFMLFWTLNFIVALGQMTMSGSFASYYWAFRKPKDIPLFPVSGALWRSLRYHMGTMAFGALILAIVQMIRVGLEYLDSKLKGKENPLAKFALKCLKCCFWCLEKFIKFVNKNAYIMCAIYGKNFCVSAFTAFSLIFRNIIRFAVVDKVTDFVLFVCKLFVVAAVFLISFSFFSGDLAKRVPVASISDYVKDYTPELNYYITPVLLISFGSYIIAAGFFAVYNMGVETLFLCFLQDSEVNDGTEDKPYYMSKNLLKILSKKNKEEVAEKKEEIL